MSDINSLHAKIGALEAQAMTAAQERREINLKLEAINIGIRHLQEKLEAQILAQKMEMLTLKNRGVGVAIGLALAGGGIGSAMATFLQSVFKH